MNTVGYNNEKNNVSKTPQLCNIVYRGVMILENLIHVNTELDKLNREQREVFNLRIWQGHTQAETGKLMGISQQKVSRIEKQLHDRFGI